jgi:hypothetical protein
VFLYKLQGLQWQLLHICKSRPDIVLIGRMTCSEGIEPVSVGQYIQDAALTWGLLLRLDSFVSLISDERRRVLDTESFDTLSFCKQVKAENDSCF